MTEEERNEIFERAYNDEQLPMDKYRISENILSIIKNDGEANLM